MTRIHLTTLGSLRIEREGEEIRDLPAQPVRCALLLYLALERGATRDELAALLWPERESDRARHSLSQTLYELRRQLGEGWMESRGERIEVSPAVTVDALEFEAAAGSERDEEALALYAGPFLEGCHPGTSAAFEQWVERRRAQLARAHRDLCRRLVETRIESGDAAGALAAARRWAETEPLEDEAHHRIIELLAGSGRRAEALRHYEEYRERIARELEVEPLEETQALVARIRESAAPMAGTREPVADSPSPGGVEPHSLPAADASQEAEPRPAARREERLRPRWAFATTPGQHWLLAMLAAILVTGMILLWGRALSSPSAGAADESVLLDPQGIAVLPFLNMSADPEQEYFSDGITEDLLTSLSRIHELRVISRTSVMRYKRTELPVGEIARELGVRYLLEGSVRRDGDQVRVTAQLIDAADDAHLWAETYDREMSGIFQLQSEIAQRIAGALARQLSPADRTRIAAGGTANLAAYDLLLRGREYLNRPGDADLRKYAPATNFFRQALEVDPRYARAYVGLSEAFLRNPSLLPTTRSDSALLYARHAVEADPELAEAAATLGAAHALAGERERAEREFRRALVLDRNQAEAMAGLARLAALGGRLDEAVRWQRRAVAVDPSSAARLVVLGHYLFDLGDLAGAEAAFARAVEFAPDYPEPSFLLAQIHLIRGEPERADARMQALLATAADHPATRMLMGRYQAQRGRYEDAEAHLDRSPGLGAVRVFQAYVARQRGQAERLDELLRAPEQSLLRQEREGTPIPPRAQLYLRALRGDRDRALATLAEHWRTGLRTHVPDPPEIGVYWLDAEPFLEELRGDPRFQALLRRMRAELDSMRLLLKE